ncbi:GNAT family N-acetyltransferase [Phytomonospora endophytica]|uniref:GNAT superfamily N-acetyltransferase n=1 Tax=Phytomonospora endophytica TaxID=714109 RepID=A0A841F5Z4_9ACTN|nr:GNAT family N-acetyltransferase [Phytomonospora endophytica]MBB6032351.1 GNAT superfamily N-acetyltransferase [Phytomonospora endophytica]GIG68699.1 GNAT family N-acetyltransferase [Phytomonospora endophytica]
MTGDRLNVRRAHIGDTAVLNELFVQLGYPQDAPGATASRIQSWSEDPAGAALVAEADGKVLGVVAVHVCPYLERPGSWGRIVALVVSDRARRQGVAGRLVAAAEAFAESRGCVRMEVTSANRRDDAHGFYRSRGYADQSERSSRFLRELGGPGGS